MLAVDFTLAKVPGPRPTSVTWPRTCPRTAPSGAATRRAGPPRPATPAGTSPRGGAHRHGARGRPPCAASSGSARAPWPPPWPIGWRNLTGATVYRAGVPGGLPPVLVLFDPVAVSAPTDPRPVPRLDVPAPAPHGEPGERPVRAAGGADGRRGPVGAGDAWPGGTATAAALGEPRASRRRSPTELCRRVAANLRFLARAPGRRSGRCGNPTCGVVPRPRAAGAASTAAREVRLAVSPDELLAAPEAARATAGRTPAPCRRPVMSTQPAGAPMPAALSRQEERYGCSSAWPRPSPWTTCRSRSVPPPRSTRPPCSRRPRILRPASGPAHPVPGRGTGSRTGARSSARGVPFRRWPAGRPADRLAAILTELALRPFDLTGSCRSAGIPDRPGRGR